MVTRPECFAVPLLERQRFQLHHQPQQPDAELFRAPGLRSVNYQLIHRGQRVRFGDPAGHPVNDPHLLGVECAGTEGLPYGGQAGRQPPCPGYQAAHRIRLLPQQHRHLVRHELPRPHSSRAPAGHSDAVLIRFDPNVGILHTGLGQHCLRSSCSPPRRHHIVAGRLQLPEFDHALILAGSTDKNRTHERFCPCQHRRVSQSVDLQARHERTAVQRLLDQPHGTTRPSEPRLLLEPGLSGGLHDLIRDMPGQAGANPREPLLGGPALALDELGGKSRQHHRVVA
jgi:hypothetical protein